MAASQPAEPGSALWQPIVLSDDEGPDVPGRSDASAATIGLNNVSVGAETQHVGTAADGARFKRGSRRGGRQSDADRLLPFRLAAIMVR